MKMSRVPMLVIGVGVLSGCAGTHGSQQLARLQSQVGLLDERVTQLERLNLGETSAAVPSSPAADWATPISSQRASGISTKRPTAATSASPASASVKPGTREIQQALKNAGFYQGAIDGKLGPQTREAIKEFQRVHGLTDDGVAGKQTWAKLRAYTDLSGGDLSTAEVIK